MTEKSLFIKTLEDELDNLKKEDIQENIQENIPENIKENIPENIKENYKYKYIIGYVLLFFLLNTKIVINFINNLSFINNNANINLIIRTIVFIIFLNLIMMK